MQRLAAKGVRKTTSKFGSALEPFTLVDLQCYRGRSLDTITQAQILASFGLGITRDYDRYHSANVIVESAEKINEGHASSAQYALVVGALRALAGSAFDFDTIRDAYLTRAIALAGWSPELNACVNCGSAAPLTALSIHQGGAVCSSCKPAGSFHVLPETLELLTGYLSGNWQIAQAASGNSKRQAAGFIAAYLQWHLEYTLKSLSVAGRTLTNG